MKVKIYTTPTCPFCNMAKSFLNENSVPFEAVDISEDSEALKDMKEKSGQSGVPVFDIEGEIIIGFKRSRIKELLSI